MLLPGDAGHTGAGLTLGQGCDGQCLSFRQARSSLVQPVDQAMWMVSSHSSRLVHESVVKWTTGMVHMVLWQQVQGHRQWSLVPGLQQQVQQGHRQPRPGHPSTQATMHTLSTNRPVQNYLVPRLCSIGQVPVWIQNYVVPWLCSVGPVPRSADSYGDYTKSRVPRCHRSPSNYSAHFCLSKTFLAWRFLSLVLKNDHSFTKKSNHWLRTMQHSEAT